LAWAQFAIQCFFIPGLGGTETARREDGKNDYTAVPKVLRLTRGAQTSLLPFLEGAKRAEENAQRREKGAEENLRSTELLALSCAQPPGQNA